jgi:hypothetical protein
MSWQRNHPKGLSADERAEYEAWVRAINWLGILQAKARKVMTDQ